MSEACCLLVNFYLDNDVLNDSNKFIIKKEKKENLIIITKNDKTIFTEKILSELSQKEQEDLPNYWIYVKADCDYCGLTNYIHLFQLSLLIVKPTAVKIFYKYNKEDLTRFEDIFKFVEESPDNIELDDLKLVRKFYPIMLEIFKNNKRLRSALVLMLNGCTAIHWDAAYILFVTAFEALLSHIMHISKKLAKDQRWGIKKKLAWAYAVLTETDNEKRQKAFNDFRDIYKIRSEILHGEFFEDKYNDGKLNLKELAKCRDMLRKLWQVILNSDEIIKALSEDDKIRRDYFKTVANGWMLEEENGKKEFPPYRKGGREVIVFLRKADT